MNINLLNSEPSLANNKFDNKGINVLSGDEEAFQKILKNSEDEQLSSTKHTLSSKVQPKFSDLDGKVLNHKNKIAAKSLLSDDEPAEKVTPVVDETIIHTAVKNKANSQLNTNVNTDGDLSELATDKNSKSISRGNILVAKSSTHSEADSNISSELEMQRRSTKEYSTTQSTLKSDPKLVSDKTTVPITDVSAIKQDGKLISGDFSSDAKITNDKLVPKLASAEINSITEMTETKSKLKSVNTTLVDSADSKLNQTLKSSSVASRTKPITTEDDAKLLAALKGKKSENASSEESDSKFTATTPDAGTFVSSVFTSPMTTVPITDTDKATAIESEPTLPSTSSAATLLAATKAAEQVITSTQDFSQGADPKLVSKSDKNSIETTAKATTKKADVHLAVASDSASTSAMTAAVPISKSTEITNAVLQTLQSEKQNSDINLATTPSNHTVNLFNTPNQQPVSTPTVTLPLSVNNPQWQESFSQQIVMFNRQDIQKAEIRLHPEELGSLHIKLEMNDGKMQLQMASAHAAVRGILESAIPHLRTSLAEQGIDLQQTDISHSSMSDNTNQQSMYSEQRRGTPAETGLAQQEDVNVIDNNMVGNVTKQSGLSVFA